MPLTYFAGGEKEKRSMQRQGRIRRKKKKHVLLKLSGKSRTVYNRDIAFVIIPSSSRRLHPCREMATELLDQIDGRVLQM